MALGVVWAAFAGGSLVGILLSGTRRRFILPSDAGLLTLTIAALGTIALSFVTDTWFAALIMLVNGIGGGYINVVIVTLLQHRTPPAFLGRIMSLLYFSNVGLVPISKALAGGISRLSLVTLFGGAGILLLLVAMWVRGHPAYRSLDIEVKQHVVI